MANLILPPGWRIPDREATSQSVYWNRKAFLSTVGMGAAALASGACGSSFEEPDYPLEPEGDCAAVPPAHPLQSVCTSPNASLYPATRNARHDPPLDLTERILAATHNNYYEFIGRPVYPNQVWDLTGPFQPWPWSIEISGEVERPGTFDVAALEQEFGLEERVYRHRCVEAWSMVVPWTGYPLAKLIAKVRPLSSARFVRFVSFDRPAEAVGQRQQPWYPWPYYEALRLDEAMNELAFVATGVYGDPLPKQHGAPFRLALPWKYGYKSAKGIVKIEFLREQPPIFWTDVEPSLYGFYSIVNPNVPHPNWSQEWEAPLGENRRPTILFNGYADWVMDMYDPQLLTYIS